MKKSDDARKHVIVGLTGGFGTGKSTVARFFEELGACVVDADKLAHEALMERPLDLDHPVGYFFFFPSLPLFFSVVLRFLFFVYMCVYILCMYTHVNKPIGLGCATLRTCVGR